MSMRTQTGAALIAALLVAAVAAASAAGLLYAQTLWITEAQSHHDAEQGRIAARAGIAWAAAILQQDERTSRFDHPDEPWSTELPPTDVEGSTIRGSIRDLQGRYNLNNLVRDGVAQAKEIARYKRLLQTLGLPTGLAESAADWLDADARPGGPDGAEDSYYLGQPVAYRTAGRPLGDIHELLQVKGYTPAVFHALEPYIVALPAPSAINVNTAPPEVLMLLGDRLTLAEAREIDAARRRAWFRDGADFATRLPALAGSIDASALRVTSEYFLVDARVQRGRALVDAAAILHRAAPWPRVVWQRIDG